MLKKIQAVSFFVSKILLNQLTKNEPVSFFVSKILLNQLTKNEPALPTILSYDMVIEGFDWGPAVTRLYLETKNKPATIALTDFQVSFNRLPGFIPPEGDRAPISQAATIESASVEGHRIILELQVHPQTGVNPFTFTLAPMGNDWSVPFYPVITWGSFGTSTPPQGAVRLPLTERFDITGTFTHEQVTLQYAHYTPKGTDRDLPLIIWLHGAGEGGAHILLPQAPTVWLQGTSVWGGVGDVGNYEAALLALIDQFIAETGHLDLSRIYIGGCSNGGYMVMRMLLERPALYAAAWPICLVYPEDWLTDEKLAILKGIPLWLIHDINDGTTPHEDSLRFFNLLREAGASDVHLTTTDGLFSEEFFDVEGKPWRFDDHWSWIPALNNVISEEIDSEKISLFAWMSRQRRPS